MTQKPNLDQRRRIDKILDECEEELRNALIELIQLNCDPNVIICFSSAIDSMVAARITGDFAVGSMGAIPGATIEQEAIAEIKKLN